MKLYKRIGAVMGLSVLFAQGARADISTTHDVVLGEWCGNYENVRNYADTKGVPVLVYWGRGSCPKCKHMVEALQHPEFVAWREERKIALLFAKEEGDANVKAAKAWAKGENPIEKNQRVEYADLTNMIDSDTGRKPTPLKDFPFMMVYWHKNGEVLAEKRFTGRLGTMPVKNSKLKLHELLIASVERYIDGYVPFFDDPWDPDDDTIEGAQELAFTKVWQSQAHTLSVSDTNDWFTFTPEAGATNLITFADVEQVNGTPLYQLFEGEAMVESGTLSNSTAFALTSSTAAPWFLRVYYASGAEVDIKYTINYKEYVAVAVGFDRASITFDAALGTFEIPVVRGGDNDVMKETAAVMVATSGMHSRYTLSANTLDWTGVENDVQSLVITASPDHTWIGAQTFTLQLGAVGDETLVAFDEITVTIDPGLPRIGTVGYSGYVVNGVTNNYSSSARPVVREGDTVEVLLNRTGGSNMLVTVGFTWPGSVNTGVTLSWDDAQDGVRGATITIPTGATFQPSRTMALTLTVVENATLPTQASQRTLTFNVFNQFYVGSLAAWVAQNKDLPFATTADAWFMTDGGNLRSRPVSGAAPAVMTAAVTGPGVLKFAVADGNADMALSVGNRNVAVQGGGDVYGYLIPAGKQTLTLRATGTGFAELADMAYIPLTAAVTAVAPLSGDVVPQDGIKLLWDAAGAEQLAGINGITNSYAVFAGATDKAMTQQADLAAGSTSYDLAGAALGALSWRVAIKVVDEGGTEVTFNGAVQKVTVVGANAPNFDAGAMEGAIDNPDWTLGTDASQLAVTSYIGVRAAFGPFPVVNGSTVRVKSGSLPKGMSLTQADGAWRVAGLPTKTANNVRLVLQAMNGKDAGVTFALVYTILPLPQEAFGNFTGFAKVMSETANDFGSVSLTVSAAGKISGKIVTAPKTYSFTAAGFDTAEDGVFMVTNPQFAATFKKETPIPLELAVVSRDLGEAYLYSAEPEPVMIEARLFRNGWSDKVLAPKREEALRLALDYPDGALARAPGGYYTMALPVNENYLEHDLGGENGLAGTGYLTLTVDKKGKTKLAGRLADGTAVSMAGALLTVGGYPMLLPYTAPKAYSGGTFVAEIALVRDASTGGVLLHRESMAMWESRNPRATGVQGAGFQLVLNVAGGWYATRDSLRQMYANAAEGGWLADAHQGWDVELTANSKGNGFNALPSCGSADNPACLKIAVKMNTGLITGSFNEDVGAKKPASRKIFGVLTPALTTPDGYGGFEGLSGAGFYLIPQTAPYKYNQSGNFTLTPDCGCGD